MSRYAQQTTDELLDALLASDRNLRQLQDQIAAVQRDCDLIRSEILKRNGAKAPAAQEPTKMGVKSGERVPPCVTKLADFINDQTEPVNAAQVAEKYGGDAKNIRCYLARAARAGLIERVGTGTYARKS